MISTWSPAVSVSPSVATSKSRSLATQARSPSVATAPATSQVTFGAWYSQTRSARSSDFAIASRCVPSFIVFERGSSTAISRELPMRRRSASMVTSIAVG
jgi:hypothetical protein